MIAGPGTERPDAVGLVLAAGAASRFGTPKQLARFRGQPLINWPVGALSAAGLEWVLAVLGAEHERIAAALQGAHALYAPDWQEGLSASLRAGVAAADRLGAERVIVTLADQPLLSSQAVQRVLAVSRAGIAPITRATYANRPGHPTALTRETFAAVAELRGDAGARQLAGFDSVSVPCDGFGSTDDIDTPADLERLIARSTTGGTGAAAGATADPDAHAGGPAQSSG
jgi:CTP:molybdopterin cytidylyltransferase MocA